MTRCFKFIDVYGNSVSIIRAFRNFALYDIEHSAAESDIGWNPNYHTGQRETGLIVYLMGGIDAYKDFIKWSKALEREFNNSGV